MHGSLGPVHRSGVGVEVGVGLGVGVGIGVGVGVGVGVAVPGEKFQVRLQALFGHPVVVKSS